MGGWNRHTIADKVDREIVYHASGSVEDPVLVLYIQGSGCARVVDPTERRRLRYADLVRTTWSQGVRVLAIEKPGASNDPDHLHGTAEDCGEEYWKQHTLELWSGAVQAVLHAEASRTTSARRKVLLIGHSEGGLVAAHVAARCPAVTHVALISSTGPTQLFDFVRSARLAATERGDSPATAVADLMEIYSEIMHSPDAFDQAAWGHPFRRWSSFLGTSTLTELLSANACAYVVHGTKDSVVPVESAEMLFSELATHGRCVTFEYILEGEHQLGRGPGSDVISSVLRRLREWQETHHQDGHGPKVREYRTP